MYETRRHDSGFQSALRFAVLPDSPTPTPGREDAGVSIRFKVRGASRHVWNGSSWILHRVSIRFKVRGASRPRKGSSCEKKTAGVSIRFKVRGASRRETPKRLGNRLKFQSALRFAVLPDGAPPVHWRGKEFQSALRFAVLPDMIVVSERGCLP